MGITRGTTPTIKMKLDGIDSSLIDICYVTLEQPTFELTKEAEFIDDHYEITLTQEETLKFKDGNVMVQMKIKLKNKKVVATNIVTKTISEILNEEII